MGLTFEVMGPTSVVMERVDGADVMMRPPPCCDVVVTVDDADVIVTVVVLVVVDISFRLFGSGLGYWPPLVFIQL